MKNTCVITDKAHSFKEEQLSLCVGNILMNLKYVNVL